MDRFGTGAGAILESIEHVETMTGQLAIGSRPETDTGVLQDWAAELFVCPSCGHSLSLEVFNDEPHDEDGIFSCPACPEAYPLVGGIPRFVDTSQLEETPSYQRYLSEHGEALADHGTVLPGTAIDSGDPQHSLEAQTDASFGYQWDRFNDWGWQADEKTSNQADAFYTGATLSDTRRAWRSKSLLTDDDIASEKLILDAGCGNGRFSHQAAEKGGHVIGVDIGTATVEAAHSNCASDNVQIVQASLFDLPFPPETFDTIFSIGVLHHTGDAREAFRSIGSRLKPGGVMTVHVYHELNPFWEFNDSILRSVTTRLSITQNVRFARFMAGMAAALHRVHPLLLHGANLLVRLQPTVTHMFDWYSAPVASHHTYSEVERWFLDDEFAILQSNKPADYDRRRLLLPWAATVKGQKHGHGERAGHHPWYT